MSSICYRFCITVFLFAPHIASATSEDSTKQTRNTWTVLPIIFSSPDTRFGFGVLPQYVFHTTPGSRTSHIKLEAYYTQNRQFDIRLSSGLWLPGNRFEVNGSLRLQEWPTSFYGIGNRFVDSLKEGYTERIMQASVAVLRRLKPGLYAGAGYDLRYGDIRETEAGRMLAGGTVVGSTGGIVAGVGAFLSYDTRDVVFYPTRGALVRLETHLFSRIAGSDYAFTQHRLDARWYVGFAKRHVVALQGEFRIATGIPPFQMLSGVGQVVRGYSSKRFSDRHLLAFQVEYRLVPVIWRFGIAVFAGAGQVAHDFGDFAVDRFHLAYGAGIRFQLIRSENINVRWDFGFGADSSGDYLELNEDF